MAETLPVGGGCACETGVGLWTLLGNSEAWSEPPPSTSCTRAPQSRAAPSRRSLPLCAQIETSPPPPAECDTNARFAIEICTHFTIKFFILLFGMQCRFFCPKEKNTRILTSFFSQPSIADVLPSCKNYMLDSFFCSPRLLFAFATPVRKVFLIWPQICIG